MRQRRELRNQERAEKRAQRDLWYAEAAACMADTTHKVELVCQVGVAPPPSNQNLDEVTGQRAEVIVVMSHQDELSDEQSQEEKKEYENELHERCDDFKPGLFSKVSMDTPQESQDSKVPSTPPRAHNQTPTCIPEWSNSITDALVYDTLESGFTSELVAFCRDELLCDASPVTQVNLQAQWLLATLHNDLDSIKWLVTSRYTSSSTSSHALCLASRFGYLEIVKELVNTYMVSTAPYTIGILEKAHSYARIRGRNYGALIIEHLLGAIYGSPPIPTSSTQPTESFGHDYIPPSLPDLPIIHPYLVAQRNNTHAQNIGHSVTVKPTGARPLSSLARLQAWVAEKGPRQYVR